MLKNWLKKITANHVLAGLFLVYIFFLALDPLPQLLSYGKMLLRDPSMRSFSSIVQAIDSQYKIMLSADMKKPVLRNNGTYINFNGYMAELLDQTYINDRIKLNNGQLVQLQEIMPVDELMISVADNIATVSNRQKEAGKNLLFVLAPTKIIDGEDLMPVGYTDTTKETSDLLIALLEERGVDCLDLRENFREEGMVAADSFFVTDHHWLPQTGFWAYNKIVEKLADMGIFSEVDPAYTAEENFHFNIYEDCFLGSSGKRAGIYYAGTDDFCVIKPKFDTHLTVEYYEDETVYEGRFENVVNNPLIEEMLIQTEVTDYFDSNPYVMYGFGDTAPALRLNENAPEKTKIMLIGDSYNNVPFGLLSLYASSTYEIDTRALSPDLLKVVPSFEELYNEYQPDTIIFLIQNKGCFDPNMTYEFFPS